MSPALIAQLVIALGPSAITFIQKLASVWTKSVLTPEEVLEICAATDQSYQQLKAEVKTQLGK